MLLTKPPSASDETSECLRRNLRVPSLWMRAQEDEAKEGAAAQLRAMQQQRLAVEQQFATTRADLPQADRIAPVIVTH